MDIYDPLLPKDIHKTSRILLNDALEFDCDVTTIVFYEYSCGAETNATLVYCKRKLKIKGDFCLQKHLDLKHFSFESMPIPERPQVHLHIFLCLSIHFCSLIAQKASYWWHSEKWEPKFNGHVLLSQPTSRQPLLGEGN